MPPARATTDPPGPILTWRWPPSLGSRTAVKEREAALGLLARHRLRSASIGLRDRQQTQSYHHRLVLLDHSVPLVFLPLSRLHLGFLSLNREDSQHLPIWRGQIPSLRHSPQNLGGASPLPLPGLSLPFLVPPLGPIQVGTIILNQDRVNNRRPREGMLGRGGVVVLEEEGGEMPSGGAQRRPLPRLQVLPRKLHLPRSPTLRSRPALMSHGVMKTLSGEIRLLC
ncbi:hypothetical protein BJV77DRAFT_313625 [Russula vinacea]|nr:hypothetical protein BJV77DRAFT_313625 [Russula vinacea]